VAPIEFLLERGDRESEILVMGWGTAASKPFSESRAVRDCSLNVGGDFHPKLNMCDRPIENKYRE
jgi:hypothetical protein